MRSAICGLAVKMNDVRIIYMNIIIGLYISYKSKNVSTIKEPWGKRNANMQTVMASLNVEPYKVSALPCTHRWPVSVR